MQISQSSSVLPDISKMMNQTMKRSKEGGHRRVFKGLNMRIERGRRNSSQRRISNLVNKTPTKRKSLQKIPQPLTKYQKRCVKMHINLISRSRQKVIDAKERRFKGFFSPRLLSKKASSFAFSRTNVPMKTSDHPCGEIKSFLRT
ncbi:unnamed protein product [Moneuplotes crassus]|uniref:Uncharacterized protein n=1 Tax=Euplotes crassus TaxID=5936 RepID=A0AAD1UK80_EUPCR|nr:unnamed protein product [Moneuplotes crassus]